MNPADCTPGQQVGDFVILRTLGKGANAVVYLARQVSLGREVALKVSEATGNAAKTMVSLDHDHIIPVYSEVVEPSAGLRLICMPYLRGVTLETIIQGLGERDRRELTGKDLLSVVDNAAVDAPAYAAGLMEARQQIGRLSFEEAVGLLGLKLAEALCYAHQSKVLHLDIKPANILIDHSGRPYLADFNLSHAGTEGDERADIYSLGLALSELLGGTGELTPKKSLELDVNLREVLQHCTVNAPADRFQTVQDLIRALEGYFVLNDVVKNMPSPGPIMRFSLRYPVTALIAIPMVPQLVGTTVARFYAKAYTGTQLTPSEKAYMMKVGAIYPMISYPTALFLSLVVIWPLALQYRKRKALIDETPGRQLDQLRRRTLRMPVWRALINSLTWLSAIPFFQYAGYRMGKFNLKGALHFSSFIILAWLIATIYSAIYNAFFAVRVFYPRFLGASGEIRAEVRRELHGIKKWLRIFPLLTPLIPLAAGVNLVAIGADEFSPERYHAFQVLLLFLIGSGVGGFLITLKVRVELGRVVAALQGPQSDRKE